MLFIANNIPVNDQNVKATFEAANTSIPIALINIPIVEPKKPSAIKIFNLLFSLL
jgi:hypothetical protein